MWGWGLGPQKKFSTLSFEMLNFYAFCTLEQGDSIAAVIATMMFMTSAHQCHRENVGLLVARRPRSQRPVARRGS